MHESPPFDGLSANRGGEIRTRDLLNPIQARYRAAPRPDAEICGLLRGSAGLQTANPAQIPPNVAHNVAHLGAGGVLTFPAAKIREWVGECYYAQVMNGRQLLVSLPCVAMRCGYKGRHARSDYSASLLVVLEGKPGASVVLTLGGLK